MAKHRCDKEGEIAAMHTDIKWIRKSLEGNGKPGLVSKIDKNTEHRTKQEAKGSMIKMLVGGGWLTTILLFVADKIWG